VHKSIKKTPALTDSKVLWWIYGGLAFVTLYFNSKIKDPFNSPKMWIVILLSAWLMGHLLMHVFKYRWDKSLSPVFLILSIFLTGLLISSLKTDVIYTAFFGENLRRNGFITYLSLTIIMVSTILFVRIASITRFIYVTYFIGIYLAIYGWLQSTGRDFIQWNNPYNSIIGTVGNPNFAASLMAIVGIICVGGLLSLPHNTFIKLLVSIIPLVLLFLIYKSGSRQGLIISALGYFIIVAAIVYTKRKSLGILFACLFFGISIFAVLGMLQIGPLAQYLYKGSVTVRGYYWKAGIAMFQNNPIFGVGVDSYGSYFKQYRDVGYPLKYGFNITSTNAHNTPIQFFATAGLLVGLSYLAIQIYILFRAIIAIKKYQGKEHVVVVSILAAWIAFQAQSLISIDNIGISIWGWVLGGMLIGLSLNNNGLNNTNRAAKRGHEIEPLKLFISILATVPALALIMTLYRAEATMLQTQALYKPEKVDRPANLYDYGMRTLQIPLLEPAFKLNIGVYFTTSGFTSEGLDILNKLLKSDPRNQDLLNTLAEFNEQKSDLDAAIINRVQLSQFDPWNAANYFRLGLLYKAQSDQVNMVKMREKIISFAAFDPIAEQASKELQP